jgi:dephospho-CoA kinase
MPRIIGLTGNIACGKTSVGHMLLELGAERYIDADALVHRLYVSGQAIAVKVGKTFGSTVLNADGSVDRKALGALVFQRAEALQQLEQIVHPAVGEALRAELLQVSATGIAIIDAVKLLQSASASLCQSKWLVLCTEEQELARLIARNHLRSDEALARLRAQPDPIQQRALVDEIIDNSGSLESTRQQVSDAFARFRQQFSN